MGKTSGGPLRALRLLAALLCLAAHLGAAGRAAADGGRAVLVKRVALRGGPVDIEIGFDADQRAWGAYQLRQAAAYLPAVEAYLGVGLHEALPGFLGREAFAAIERSGAPFRIRIQGQREVLLNGSWIGAYNNSAGNYPGERGIYVEYNLSRLGSPSLIFHELGHFWLYDSAGVTQATEPGTGRDRGSASWFNEGAVAVLPLAVRQARLLKLTPSECAAVGEHMGMRRVPFQVDAPIEEDPRPRGGPLLLLFYQKAFTSHVLIRHYLGSAAYRGLLSSAARAPADLYSTERVLSLLWAKGPLPWRKLLSGWVFRGPYGPIAPAAFRDASIQPDGSVDIPAAAAPIATPAPPRAPLPR